MHYVDFVNSHRTSGSIYSTANTWKGQTMFFKSNDPVLKRFSIIRGVLPLFEITCSDYFFSIWLHMLFQTPVLFYQILKCTAISRVVQTTKCSFLFIIIRTLHYGNKICCNYIIMADWYYYKAFSRRWNRHWYLQQLPAIYHTYHAHEC